MSKRSCQTIAKERDNYKVELERLEDELKMKSQQLESLRSELDEQRKAATQKQKTTQAELLKKQKKYSACKKKLIALEV